MKYTKSDYPIIKKQSIENWLSALKCFTNFKGEEVLEGRIITHIVAIENDLRMKEGVPLLQEELLFEMKNRGMWREIEWYGLQAKYDFRVMADFPSAWGFLLEDGKCAGEIAGRLTNEIEGVYINQTLRKKLNKWVYHFERNYENPEMDWDTFNKTGIRLAILLKKQIGHLYNKFYYEPPFEDWTTVKYSNRVRIEII